MFNKGDKVEYHHFDPNTFTSRKLKGDIGTIVDIMNMPTGEVYLVHFDTVGVMACEPEELRLISSADPLLPKGAFQSLLDGASDPGPKGSCNCGAYKTHGDIPSDAHSSWCRVNEVSK